MGDISNQPRPLSFPQKIGPYPPSYKSAIGKVPILLLQQKEVKDTNIAGFFVK